MKTSFVKTFYTTEITGTSPLEAVENQINDFLKASPGVNIVSTSIIRLVQSHLYEFGVICVFEKLS